MAALQNSVFNLLTIAFLMANAATSVRDFPVNDKPKSDLAMMLQNSNASNTTACWTALSELRSCSNEIVGFFLNGYTDIDMPCCHAIEVITGHCWSSMLGVLGFTAGQGKLLAGYCDKFSAPTGTPSAPAGGLF